MPVIRTRGPAWTQARRDELRALVEQGLAAKVIARRIGRTDDAVKSQMKLMGLRILAHRRRLDGPGWIYSKGATRLMALTRVDGRIVYVGTFRTREAAREAIRTRHQDAAA